MGESSPSVLKCPALRESCDSSLGDGVVPYEPVRGLISLRIRRGFPSKEGALLVCFGLGIIWQVVGYEQVGLEMTLRQRFVFMKIYLRTPRDYQRRMRSTSRTWRKDSHRHVMVRSHRPRLSILEAGIPSRWPSPPDVLLYNHPT